MGQLPDEPFISIRFFSAKLVIDVGNGQLMGHCFCQLLQEVKEDD